LHIETKAGELTASLWW